MDGLVSITQVPKHLHVFSKYKDDETGEFGYSECDFIGVDEYGGTCFLEISEDGLFSPEDVSNFVQFIIFSERNTNWMNEAEFKEYRKKTEWGD